MMVSSHQRGASLMFASVALLVLLVGASRAEHEDVSGTVQNSRNRLLESDLVEDDGSLDTALINYLFARQMIKRLQNNLDVSDLQRKRSYWKQCAFNAVSCFGRKKK